MLISTEKKDIMYRNVINEGQFFPQFLTHVEEIYVLWASMDQGNEKQVKTNVPGCAFWWS